MLTYRTYVNETKDVISYEIFYKETALLVRAPRNFSTKILRTLISLRKPLEKYIEKHKEFLTSLKPISPHKDAPQIVRVMCEVAQKTNTGPMSAVAGTIAELLGYEMLKWLKKQRLRKFLIIENGGDIFAYVDEPITVGIYAGENSPFTGKVSIKINLLNQPLGICTSSGTVGHSLSFGKADACVIISNSASFSDALATATCNLVKTENDVKTAVEFAKNFDETLFVCIIKNRLISFWSKTEQIEFHSSHNKL
ncbi:MAG: UPF0280 family protein [Elusimicrobiota bacterium]|nr:UPF0280 family protein [Elusimicrobiota bacterium]